MIERGKFNWDAITPKAPPTAPAASTDCSHTVPVGSKALLTAVFLKLVTSAGVAERAMQLIVDNGTPTGYKYTTPTGTAMHAHQSASLENYYFYSAGLPVIDAEDNIVRMMPMCALALRAGDRIRTVVDTLTALDQVTPQWIYQEAPI